MITATCLEELGGKVYGSTPYPADETILFHNESSHMHRWPMLIWFYCVKAATAGGESPLIDCRRIYQSLDHDIREQFEQKGLLYVRNFTDGLDVSWQNFFHHDKGWSRLLPARGIEFVEGSVFARGRSVRNRHSPADRRKVFFNRFNCITLSGARRARSLLSMMETLYRETSISVMVRMTIR